MSDRKISKGRKPCASFLSAHRSMILSILIVVAGIILLSYPWISNYVYEHGVESTVKVYEKQLDMAADQERQEMLEKAKVYNAMIAQSRISLTDPFIREEDTTEQLDYINTLSLDEQGLMCFVDIPKIDVYLPVFHGTSSEVLEKGVGHLEGSSLPVGGIGTHTILSGHTGMNAAKIFSDLTALEEGDLFFIHVLDETLAYRVSGIAVILPEDTSLLNIEKDKDLATLITCTPYGVNTHRLVVTGERTEYSPEVETEAKSEVVQEDSQWMKAYKKALLLGMGVVGAVWITGSMIKRKKERN